MQATSADKLLAATREVLGEKGYEAATVREISNAAGVPQGLIHYYFGGKEGLLAELLRREALAYRFDQDQLTAANPDALDATRSALARRRRRVDTDPGWHRMRFELFALGLRTPRLGDSLRELLGIGRSGVRQILDRLPGAGGRDTASLAAVVLACTDGLALQKLADPAFDLEAAYSALTDLIEGVLH